MSLPLVIDGNWRFPGPISSLSNTDLGEFDQCLAAGEPNGRFTGKYCLMRLGFDPKLVAAILSSPLAQPGKIFSYQNLDAIWSNNPSTRLRTSICVPSVCQEWEIKSLIDDVIGVEGLQVQIENCQTANWRAGRVSKAHTLFGYVKDLSAPLLDHFIEDDCPESRPVLMMYLVFVAWATMRHSAMSDGDEVAKVPWYIESFSLRYQIESFLKLKTGGEMAGNVTVNGIPPGGARHKHYPFDAVKTLMSWLIFSIHVLCVEALVGAGILRKFR